jgi:hypothetical protein
MGQSYTRREDIEEGGEVVAHVTQLKRIDQRDRMSFLLTVTDCLSTRSAT